MEFGILSSTGLHQLCFNEAPRPLINLLPIKLAILFILLAWLGFLTYAACSETPSFLEVPILNPVRLNFPSL